MFILFIIDVIIALKGCVLIHEIAYFLINVPEVYYIYMNLDPNIGKNN